MDPSEVTVGANVALTDGAVGAVIAIAGDDDTRRPPTDAPVRIRFSEGQIIDVA
jgi:hypothetical protein